MRDPFYDPLLTYEENYNEGPFGEFADGKIIKQNGDPRYSFLGQKVYLPFGIPAGPLINSNFVKGAFEKGFDICVYKTVRSNAFPCHAFPNVLSLDINKNLTLEKLKKPLISDTKYKNPISITNSFGVPSKIPDVWQEDVKKAISYAGKGQVLVLSFMGTVKKDQSQEEFIKDFVLAGKLAFETGAKILEANLSCPNIGNEGLVCYNLVATEKITREIRKVIHNTPFILKVGYYKNNKDIERLAHIANEYADDISGINTLQATIIDKNGKQALPGPNRLRSGVCGHAIKWAGLDFGKRLKRIKDKRNYKFSITGVGGVTNAKDYFEYKKIGVDSVMSATGAMWDPYLAQEVKKMLNHSVE